VVVSRRERSGWFWVVQAAFASGLFLLAGVLKLPPRLALPLLGFWLLTNLIFWLLPASDERNGAPSAQPRLALPLLVRVLGTVAGLMVLSLYGAKIWHRHQVLSREQHRHETTLGVIGHQEARLVRILAGTNDLLKSLSPFRSYSLGRQPVLLLTGWSAHDASQAPLRQALSGSADQTECLRRLAELETYGSEADALWVLTPETAQWLGHRFRLTGPGVQLWQGPLPIPYSPDLSLWRYHIQEPDNH
jgi:hypothetical protein